jgi:uncharacterized membrane protein YjdF
MLAAESSVEGDPVMKQLDVRGGELAVLVFTLIYVSGFTVWFLLRGNTEFVVYVATMLLLIGLVARSRRSAAFPLPMLWALSFWGLAHMAGGGVIVDGKVLYALRLIPMAGSGELTILKYDQVVHAYGFGVTAWLLWHVLVRNFPTTRGSRTSYVFPVLASMGLGATNEIIEFTAVLMVPHTNVGGYFNTALDLVFNALGAVLAMILIAWFDRRHLAHS